MVGITKTLSLKIIRPYYSEEIEREIVAEKESRKNIFIEKNRNLLTKEEIEKEAKKATRLDTPFWEGLKKKHPEIITKSEFTSLMIQMQRQMAEVYNKAISELYIEKVVKKSNDSPAKLLSHICYPEAYDVFKDSSIALGLRQKIQSNFNKSKLTELYAAKISLPTAKSYSFPIAIYKQSSGDKDKGFEVQQREKDFILRITLPPYEVKEEVNKKTGKSYKVFTFLESRNKKEVFLLLSTGRRRKNKGWARDEGTDSEIRRLISGELKEEWNKYAEEHYSDEQYKKAKGRRKDSNGIMQNKELDSNEVKSMIRNNYKVGWVEINRGKKIGEKTEWFLNLVIKYPPKIYDLDKKIVGGIDIGLSKPIVCAVSNSLSRLVIDKNDVLSFNVKALSRRRSILRQNRYSRAGHGSKNKLKPVTLLTEKNERHRKKIMELWAKQVADFFVKNKVGLVQRENLTSLKNKKSEDDFFKFQRMYWPYAKLQQLIDNKLEEHGIEVKEINPRYTSQICHSCGKRNEHFDFEYRKKQKFPPFRCEKCKKEDKYVVDCDADYNAAKNMANPNIEKIAEKC